MTTKVASARMGVLEPHIDKWRQRKPSSLLKGTSGLRSGGTTADRRLGIAAAHLDRRAHHSGLYDDLHIYHPAPARPARRGVQAGCGEPSISGRNRHRDRDAQVDGCRTAHARPMGKAICRLCSSGMGRHRAFDLKQSRHPAGFQANHGRHTVLWCTSCYPRRPKRW